MNEKYTDWDAYGRSRDIWFLRKFYLHHHLSERKIISLLKEMSPSIKVLDIGCGDGYYLNVLSKMGFQHVQGVDPSHSFIERCRKRGFSVRQKSLDELSENGQFDLILLMQVLEHLEDPIRAVLIIKRLLRHKGHLLLTVPVCDSFLKRYHRFRYKIDKLVQVKAWDNTHKHAFSASVLRELLRISGFRVEKEMHASNPYPWVGRYGGEKPAKYFQRWDFGGRFGDVLIVLASKQEKNNVK